MKVTDITDVALEGFRAAIEELRAGGYRYFDWLSAVDQTDAEEAPGFDLVCHLIDVDRAEGLRSILVRTRVPDGAAAPSLTPLDRGAAWHERETHEMFGIDFDGFEDGSGLGMRPLLLPDGFEGTPLRKSFMLAARASKAWPGGKEPGEGHEAKSPSRRRVQAPGVPPPEWGPR
ncbi:MAG: NADH-quinone oxidoreductase subunit C [Dermatophilaceae bacterium]